MDVVLPVRIKNEQKFFECAFKLGFDEMSVHKFLFMFHQSDLDTFHKMGDERITVLIYSWELCEDYKMKLSDDEWELPEEMEMMIKLLVPWSLDVWFSREWERCKVMLRYGLIHCLNRARGLLMRMPDMMQINWDFLLLYNQTPWQVPYLKAMTVKKEKTLDMGGQTIESEELPATAEDLKYVKTEQLSLIVLRLIKLFDQGSIDMVKTLCMRVISAWNKIYHTELETSGTRLPYVPPEDKRCLLLICHIYLMAIYEADDVKGYVIDNMINNIRFYYQGFQSATSSYAMDNSGYTPARFIALTCVHLRLQKREFFDFFIWNYLDMLPVNLSGVVAQAYKSYLLGNLLMELNNMNEDDFAANAALYKRLMNSYVNEREKSEMFMIGEMQKLEAQHYAHNIQSVQPITDFKNKICKGNRMSNIGNYENVDDVMNHKVAAKVKKEWDEGEFDEDESGGHANELSVDPIFQNIPNNEEILYYVYDVLAKKSYRGWQFAKIVLLFKIISHELNMLETWRYHPGLTTNFMLSLETKLSQHYIDLAKIFKDYPFMEQEFWLTAFYLNPTHQSYEAVKRLGIRSNRKRNEEPTRWTTGKDTIEAKYGLLSSTIDVKEIVVLANNDEPNSDYIPLSEALQSLHLPDSVIKDILTVVFLPRNKSFSWAVEWNDLRRRCKMLMSNASEKKRFVELTMAEANDRLKFLNIDYEKYKNRPQLDYGTIEQGYENLVNSGDIENDSDVSEEEDDFEDDEDVYENQKGSSRGCKKQEEVIADDNSQEDDPYLVGRRRTRARTAAAMASLLSTTELTTRGKRRKLEEEAARELEKIAEKEEKSNDSKSTEATVPLIPSIAEETPDIPKRNIKECLNERPLFSNSTVGFRPLIDMWNIDKKDLQAIDGNCVSLLESSSILNRFAKLKTINKQINPMGTHEEEQIDEKEMLIANAQFVIKVGKTPEVTTTTTAASEVQAVKMEVSGDGKEMLPALASMDTIEQTPTVDDNGKCDGIPSGDQENKKDAIEVNRAENSKLDWKNDEAASNAVPKINESTGHNESVERTEQISSVNDVEEAKNQEILKKECSSAVPVIETKTSSKEKISNEEGRELGKDAATASTEEIPKTGDNISNVIEKIETETESETTDVIMKEVAEVNKNSAEIPLSVAKGNKSTTEKVDDASSAIDMPTLPLTITVAENNLATEEVSITKDTVDVLFEELDKNQMGISTNSNEDNSQKDEDTQMHDNDKPSIKETDLEEVLASIVLPVSDDKTATEEEMPEVHKNETEVMDHFDMSLLEGSSQEVHRENVLDNSNLGDLETNTAAIDKVAPHTEGSEIAMNITGTAISKSETKLHSPDSEENKSAADQFKENMTIMSPVESEDYKSQPVKNEDIADVTATDDKSLAKANVSEVSSTNIEERKSSSIVTKIIADETAIEDELLAKDNVAEKTSIDSESGPIINKNVANKIEMSVAKEDVENILPIDPKDCNSDSGIKKSMANKTIVAETLAEERVEGIDSQECKSQSLTKENVVNNSKEDTEDMNSTYSRDVKSQSIINDIVANKTVREEDFLAKEGVEDLPSVDFEDCVSESATNENMPNKAAKDNKFSVKENVKDMLPTDFEDCIPSSIVKENIDHKTKRNVDDRISTNLEDCIPSPIVNENVADETGIDGDCLTEENVADVPSIDTDESKLESAVNNKKVHNAALNDESLADENVKDMPSADSEQDKSKSTTNENKAKRFKVDNESCTKEHLENIASVDSEQCKSEFAINETKAKRPEEDDRCLEGMSRIDYAESKSESILNEKLVEKLVTDAESLVKENNINQPLDESKEIEPITNKNEATAGMPCLEPKGNKPVTAETECIETLIVASTAQPEDMKFDSDETPGSLISLEIATLDAEKNETINTYTANMSYLHLDDSKSVFDDTSNDKQLVDMPSLDSEESKWVPEETLVAKSSFDTPLLYSEESKSIIDEPIAHIPDMPSLDSEESKTAVDATLIDQRSVDFSRLHAGRNKSVKGNNLKNIQLHDMPSLDSEESQSFQEMESENMKLKKLCLTRPLRVLVHRLRPSDLENLRQPRVRIKRIRSAESFMVEFKSKRRRLNKVYIDIDESSDSLMSNSSSSWEAYRPRTQTSKLLAKRQGLRQNRTSDSDCDSNKSLSNVRKRRISTPNANSSSHSNNSTRSNNSRPSTATSNLVVTPRSASGLKLRISHAEQKPVRIRQKVKPVIVVDEIIQVSSSSFDSNTMDSVVEVPEDDADPLYEEAVIELHKSS